MGFTEYCPILVWLNNVLLLWYKSFVICAVFQYCWRVFFGEPTIGDKHESYRLGAAGGIGQALSLLLKLNLPAGTDLALYDLAP